MTGFQRIGRRGWTIAAVACMLVPFQARAAAQTSRGASAKITPAYAGPSTLMGVYTNEQANRGKDVYAGSCKACHSAATHTGAVFAKWWKGKQLSDLYLYISTRMPKNDPGSLAAEDVADVTAYLLKMNAMPVGKAEIYPDADSLKHIRIEIKRSTAPSTAKRTKP